MEELYCMDSYLFSDIMLVLQSKYIAALKEKAEQRKREQDIIYERKLHKERSKEDHLYADKDKFVTSAYRKKLEEERKWLEEEKRRQLQEEKEDDHSSKRKRDSSAEAEVANESKNMKEPAMTQSRDSEAPRSTEKNADVSLNASQTQTTQDAQPAPQTQTPQNTQPAQITDEHYKRSADALAAARERALARKRAKGQQI
ncbi:hypothetical protein ABZP36_003083 [Zizania latifolia]